MSKIKKAPIKGKIKQDYQVNLKLNVLSHKFENFQLNTKCTPRNSAQIDDSFEKLFPGLSSDEIKKFLSVDKELMQWVKSSAKNKKLLFEDPILALQKSKVKLDRSLLKKISKIKNDNDKGAAITPGLNLSKIEFSTKRTVLSKEYHQFKKQLK